MRVLVIPDVHLKPEMFHQASVLMNRGEAERTVCLMDLPDDWDQQYHIERYAETFDAAIAYAQQYPDTLWCYGNHELSYLWHELESGYSSMAAWTVQEKLLQLRRTLPEGNEIRYIHKIDNVLFCHGGILDGFVRSAVSDSLFHNADAVVDALNELRKDMMWNDSSPIWYRPQYGKGRMYQEDRLLQVVGHTPVDQICRDKNVISCDVFSTYRDGTPIGTQEFLLLDTKTWEFEGTRP